MAVLWWMCFIFLPGFIHCYENLCRTKPNVTASQSSTHDSKDAHLVIDGSRSQNYGSCAHTQEGAPAPAWVEVDLGGTYSLSHFVIYYRNQNDWKPYRFRKYYLEAGTSYSQKKICYTDNTPDSQIPDDTQNKTCKAEARYITVKTNYDAPEDSNTGPILEICEIELYGCDVGHYGQWCVPCSGCTNCDVNTGFCYHQCSEHCAGRECDVFGTCSQGCVDGYWGNMCTNQCPLTCSVNVCERNGNCNACKENYTGNMCETRICPNCFEQNCANDTGKCKSGCINGFHGPYCIQPCSDNCFQGTCDWHTGDCSLNCVVGYYGPKCETPCSSTCSSQSCKSDDGTCINGCQVGYYGSQCRKRCYPQCKNEMCNFHNGHCDGGCNERFYGDFCNLTCYNCFNGTCSQSDGSCMDGCLPNWTGDMCDKCRPDFYGANCTKKCSSKCLNGHCHAKNGTCLGGCKSGFLGDQCSLEESQSSPSDVPVSAIGAGAGTVVFVIVAILIVILFIRFRRQKSDKKSTTHVSYSGDNINISRADNKLYTNIGNVSVPIEDPEEEPQIENPEEAVYYNDLSVAKDVAVSNLMNVIKEKEAKENEGFLKEFKSLPYGERFACDTAKTDENVPKNRFKTTFPYDHARVVLEVGKGFASDYINANYIENMEGKREFIACQGPRENTLVDHWRMIWQEHVEYIVMLTNLIEGPKVKCHQYWPDEGKELDINPFSVTLVEEKVYAYFVERKMTVHKKRVTGSRTVVQYHYTRWPDHGTPNPLNLVVFHRHFRHKIRSTQHPIIVHCSAGIGRTGTFIALDVLSRYGKDNGKVNVIEYVKAMRRDRMTMIQNVDQYVFLYHALYEYFRRKAQYRKNDEFLSLYIDVNKPDTQKQITNEFNELISLKPRYDAKDFKSGKKYSKLNLTKSVLPVEQYLVYLTSHVPGRESYYNAVNVSSFTRADEFISAQLPVPGAAIDLVRLLLDHETEFLITLNPLSEFKELQSWVDENVNPVKLSPFTLTKDSQTTLSKDIRKTSIKIIKKEENEETHDLQIFECLNWSSSEILPKETSTLTNLIKQFSLDRKSHSSGHVTVISKDGATCCGVFIAVYNAIEQLQHDDEVDIFTIVQQLQCRRPEMISTKEEYEFCFRAAADFLNTDSVYANT